MPRERRAISSEPSAATSTLSSLTQRALYQARKLQDVASRSGGKFTLIKTSTELSSYLDRRIGDPHITAGFLGIGGDLRYVGIDEDPAFMTVAGECAQAVLAGMK